MECFSAPRKQTITERTLILCFVSATTNALRKSYTKTKNAQSFVICATFLVGPVQGAFQSVLKCHAVESLSVAS